MADIKQTPQAMIATGEATAILPVGNLAPITVIGTEEIRNGFDAACLVQAVNCRMRRAVGERKRRLNYPPKVPRLMNADEFGAGFAGNTRRGDRAHGTLRPQRLFWFAGSVGRGDIVGVRRIVAARACLTLDSV